MDYRDAERRYNEDPEFHHLVDTMIVSMLRLEFTAGELKQAAAFAGQLYERQHMRPQRVGTP